MISYIHDELGEPYYAPPHILKDMVKIGRIGRKSGAGVYDYS